MQKTTSQNIATQNISSYELKTQLASYLQKQPENIRSFHRAMKVLESIALGIIIMIFITALALSFMWKTIPIGAIPAAWFPPTNKRSSINATHRRSCLKIARLSPKQSL